MMIPQRLLEWHKLTPTSLWHSDLKKCLCRFGLLGCCKWLLGHGLMTMIIKDRLVAMCEMCPPHVSMTLWSRVMFNAILSYHSRCAQFLHHSMSMGQFWAALVPKVYSLYPTARYVLAQLTSLFKCGDPTCFHEILARSYDLSNLVAVLRLWDFLPNFWPVVQTLYAWWLISSIIPQFPHDYKPPYSWVCHKLSGTSYVPKFVWKSNNNNRQVR